MAIATILTVIISGVSLYYSNQANTNAAQANSIASSAYSILNNYPPYLDASSNGVLELRPMNCKQINASYVDCEFGGTFSVNVTVIAPHNGVLDLSATVNGIGPFSQKASYFASGSDSVQVGNATITLNPALHVPSPAHEVVQGGQPVKKTIQGQIIGLDVKMPSRLPANQVVSGSVTLAAVLTYLDIQTQTNFPRSFTIQAQLILTR
jgi:hypothetical protein